MWVFFSTKRPFKRNEGLMGGRRIPVLVSKEGLAPPGGRAEINGDEGVSPGARPFTDGGAVPPPPRRWADIWAVEQKRPCLLIQVPSLNLTPDYQGLVSLR